MPCHSQHFLSIDESLLAMLALYTTVVVPQLGGPGRTTPCYVIKRIYAPVTGSGPLQAALTQQQRLFSMLHRAAGCCSLLDYQMLRKFGQCEAHVCLVTILVTAVLQILQDSSVALTLTSYAGRSRGIVQARRSAVPRLLVDVPHRCTS
jgi:hypothetical protein